MEKEKADKSRPSQLPTYIRLLAYNYFNYLYHGIFPTKHTSRFSFKLLRGAKRRGIKALIQVSTTLMDELPF